MYQYNYREDLEQLLEERVTESLNVSCHHIIFNL